MNRASPMPMLLTLPVALGLLLDRAPDVSGQVAPSRNLPQLAYNQPLPGQALSVNRYFNDREFARMSSVLRLAFATTRFHSGLASDQLLSPLTDLSGGVLANRSDAAGTDGRLNSPSLDANPRGAPATPFNPGPQMPLTRVAPDQSRDDQLPFPVERVTHFLFTDPSRFDQLRASQIEGDDLLGYVWRNHFSYLGRRSGRSFFQRREAFERNECVGVVFQFDFGRRKAAS